MIYMVVYRGWLVGYTYIFPQNYRKKQCNCVCCNFGGICVLPGGWAGCDPAFGGPLICCAPHQLKSLAAGTGRLHALCRW